MKAQRPKPALWATAVAQALRAKYGNNFLALTPERDVAELVQTVFDRHNAWIMRELDATRQQKGPR